MTRSRCSTPEDMPVCCRAVVGPEPLLDIRSEPPPPPLVRHLPHAADVSRLLSTSTCSDCTLPIYLSSNCQDKQFDLQTWTSCLNVSAHFNMEENILHPIWHRHVRRTHTESFQTNLHNVMFIRLWAIWFLCNHMMERLMKKPHTFVCNPPHPTLSCG